MYVPKIIQGNRVESLAMMTVKATASVGEYIGPDPAPHSKRSGLSPVLVQVSCYAGSACR